jgi:hypothetical protein
MATKSSSPYGVHPAVEIAQKWVASLKEKSGRSLEEWLALTRESGLKTAQARRDWLKNVHGLGTNSAQWIADRLEGSVSEFDDPAAYLAAAENYVESMFSGKKAALRPLYEKLLQIGHAIGPAVKACPCKTMVPLYRNHVFAQIKPTTQTRIDLGFALGPQKAEGRLIDTGGYAKKDRITHRIPIESPADIDREVKRWLKAAYDADAKSNTSTA